MPTKKQPNPREALIARAIARTVIEKAVAGDTVYLRVMLEITDGFTGKTPLFVPYDPLRLDDLLDAAQTAVVRRFWFESPVMSLTAWIERTANAFTVTPPTEPKKRDKRSGKPRLAAALLGLPYDAATRAQKPFKALLRALQRAGLPAKPGRMQGHKMITQKHYIDLINSYTARNGEASPFDPKAAIANLNRMAANLPNLAVIGDWMISSRHYTARLLHTSWLENYNPQTMHRVRAVARSDGRDFIDTVHRHVIDVTGAVVILESVGVLAMQGGLPVK